MDGYVSKISPSQSTNSCLLQIKARVTSVQDHRLLRSTFSQQKVVVNWTKRRNWTRVWWWSLPRHLRHPEIRDLVVTSLSMTSSYRHWVEVTWLRPALTNPTLLAASIRVAFRIYNRASMLWKGLPTVMSCPISEVWTTLSITLWQRSPQSTSRLRSNRVWITKTRPQASFKECEWLYSEGKWLKQLAKIKIRQSLWKKESSKKRVVACRMIAAPC